MRHTSSKPPMTPMPSARRRNAGLRATEWSYGSVTVKCDAGAFPAAPIRLAPRIAAFFQPENFGLARRKAARGRTTGPYWIRGVSASIGHSIVIFCASRSSSDAGWAKSGRRIERCLDISRKRSSGTRLVIADLPMLPAFEAFRPTPLPRNRAEAGPCCDMQWPSAALQRPDPLQIAQVD